MRDSVVSDNTSAVFFGGGLWLTDGTVTIERTTITGNSVADGSAGGIMVATFGAPVTVTLQDANDKGEKWLPLVDSALSRYYILLTWSALFIALSAIALPNPPSPLAP